MNELTPLEWAWGASACKAAIGLMNQETTQKLEKFYRRPSTTGFSSLVDVEEVSATEGELLVPAVKEVTLALLLSKHTASWQESFGRRTKRVIAGMVALCHFDRAIRFELGGPVNCAVVLLRNEALELVLEETSSSFATI